jgi:hypothetical protein
MRAVRHGAHGAEIRDSRIHDLAATGGEPLFHFQ